MFRSLMAAALFCVIVAASSRAADICTAVALRDVPALEDSSAIIKKGGTDDAITQFLVNKRTGRTYLCSHGGYCYPTRIQVGGDLLEALRLTNCRVADGPAFDDGSGDLVYELDPIRSQISAAQLRYDDLDNRLLQMGLCSACADNVARYYIEKPDSDCASLTRAALEGNPDATQTLLDSPPYCTWRSEEER